LQIPEWPFFMSPSLSFPPSSLVSNYLPFLPCGGRGGSPRDSLLSFRNTCSLNFCLPLLPRESPVYVAPVDAGFRSSPWRLKSFYFHPPYPAIPSSLGLGPPPPPVLSLFVPDVRSRRRPNVRPLLFSFSRLQIYVRRTSALGP